jgi:hypothetical protein
MMQNLAWHGLGIQNSQFVLVRLKGGAIQISYYTIQCKLLKGHQPFRKLCQLIVL